MQKPFASMTRVTGWPCEKIAQNIDDEHQTESVEKNTFLACLL
jgi:hypothetical protein